MERVPVLLVDDHPVFAEALAARLGSEPDLAVVPVAHSVRQALAELARSRPAVIVLDFALGAESGLTLLDRVRAEYPDIRAVVLSAVDSVDAVVEAVRRGARAWLPKSVDVGQLVDVVRGVARGEAWLAPALLGPVLTRLTGPERVEPDRLAVLTSREREVLQCLVDGLPRETIARRLYLSGNTVRTHVQRLLAKLDCHSVLEAVAVAQRSGMRQSASRR
ncbi:MAG TPA: response regulator transcription factor [Micromonosporaceae bacterium]